MKKHMLRFLAALSAAAMLSGCGSTARSSTSSASEDKLLVTATVFPAYDFARAVCGDLAEVKLLLPPGAESHSYEPTPKDILEVEGSDLFVYLGGDSDAWVETLLESIDGGVNGMKMMDCVKLEEEAHTEGMTAEKESNHGTGEVLEYDEHVWTSPVNAAVITSAIGEQMAQLDPDHAADYRANAADYADKLMELDKEFHDFFETVNNKTMVFGDRFPLRYFADEYGLDCYAAFPGCSTQTEPSAATIAFLTQKVKQEKLGTVYYIEFSNHLVADSIAEATGAQTALFHSCHNVSQADMDAGATYLTLMEGNLETLKATMK